jgi:hypothetical protein
VSPWSWSPSSTQARPQLVSHDLDGGSGAAVLGGPCPLLWIAAGAGPKEVATRAGHMSVSFTLDRYGHLYPEADRALRDRLDRFHEAADDAE